MTDISDQYRNVAGAFTERVPAVRPEAWGNPTPCEGWVARDVVRHMVEWMPGILAGGVEIPRGPSVDDDPVGAWLNLSDALQAALDDPEVAGREFDMRAGRFRVDIAISTFCLGDVLVHTWDLARSTGLDETLDPGEVHLPLEGMEPIDEMLRASGHYGASRFPLSASRFPLPASRFPLPASRFPLPDDAEQARLIPFTGRDPDASRR